MGDYRGIKMKRFNENESEGRWVRYINCLDMRKCKYLMSKNYSGVKPGCLKKAMNLNGNRI